MKRLIGFLLILLCLGCANAEEKYSSIVEPMLFKTVDIEVVYNSSGMPSRVGGSGVFISRNGHILTCHHLFDNPGNIAGIIVSTYWKDDYFGELIYSQPRRDLALIKINEKTKTPYALLAESEDVKVGTEVLAVGSPLGLEFSVSNGIISALQRKVGIHYNLTQTNADLNPGNSGGPLFNLEGRLVGINISMLSVTRLPIFTGLGFATSVDEINKFLDQLRGI
jgi:serine protease Do